MDNYQMTFNYIYISIIFVHCGSFNKYLIVKVGIPQEDRLFYLIHNCLWYILDILNLLVHVYAWTKVFFVNIYTIYTLAYSYILLSRYSLFSRLSGLIPCYLQHLSLHTKHEDVTLHTQRNTATAPSGVLKSYLWCV